MLIGAGPPGNLRDYNASYVLDRILEKIGTITPGHRYSPRRQSALQVDLQPSEDQKTDIRRTLNKTYISISDNMGGSQLGGL